MPLRETRNTFYWVTWEVSKQSLVVKFDQFSNIRKENLSKNLMQNVAWKFVPGSF